MLKVLLKKQLMELMNSFTRSGRNNKKPKSGIMFIALFIFLLCYLAFAIYTIAGGIAEALIQNGLDWFYFAIIGLMALGLGVMGSVFSTYSMLYAAKDNDLLLSYPIRPRLIMLSRLAGVYLMGLLFELLIALPAAIAYFKRAEISALAVINVLLSVLMLSFVILALICLFGWFLALILSKVRRKNAVTIAISLLFIAAYVLVYSRMNDLTLRITENGAAMAESMRHSALYPFYRFGLAASGDIVSMLLVSGVSILLLLLACTLISKSFIKLSTAKSGASKQRFRGYSKKELSLSQALLNKEIRRFFGSAVYMLNCSLGSILMLIMAVVLLVNRSAIGEFLRALEANGLAVSKLLPLIAASVVGILSSMNIISTPSVSLEGSRIWILQAYPVPGRSALTAKLRLHAIFTFIPALPLFIAACIALGLSAAQGILAFAYTLLMLIFMDALGLYIGLQHPRLNWRTEAAAVKQDLWVVLSMLANMLIPTGFAALALPARLVVSETAYMLIVCAVLACLIYLLMRYLTTKGAKRFEMLQSNQ